MKFPLPHPFRFANHASTGLALLFMPAFLSAEVIAIGNPLDFPGSGPVGPTNPPLFPPPDLTNSLPGTALSLMDGSGGFFNPSAWQDSGGLSPSPTEFAAGVAIDRNLSVAGITIGSPFFPSGDDVYLGTGSLAIESGVYSAGFPFGVTDPFASEGGIRGTQDGGAALQLQLGALVDGNYFRNLGITVADSTLTLWASASDHASGSAISGSTIDLSGSFGLNLMFPDTSSSNPASMSDVINTYLGILTVDGFAPELGSDPLTIEPGDTLHFVPITSRTFGPDDPITGEPTVTDEWIGGWSLQSIPEPSASLLALLAFGPLVLRRTRKQA